MSARGSQPPQEPGTNPEAPAVAPETIILDSRIERALDARGIVGGGGPPHTPDMNARVTKLETHMEYVRRDLDEIKAGNRTLIDKIDGLTGAVTAAKSDTDKAIASSTMRFSDAQSIITQNLAALPSKRDLHTYALTALAIGLAVLAIVITSIVGGLDWIRKN